ncbi:hypothetical protein J6590_001881 [Homalodisca vitripennis]|nr:hypothetical protein J6590_001881 [Homalodisca vitripennis]
MYSVGNYLSVGGTLCPQTFVQRVKSGIQSGTVSARTPLDHREGDHLISAWRPAMSPSFIAIKLNVAPPKNAARNCNLLPGPGRLITDQQTKLAAVPRSSSDGLCEWAEVAGILSRGREPRPLPNTPRGPSPVLARSALDAIIRTRLAN